MNEAGGIFAVVAIMFALIVGGGLWHAVTGDEVDPSACEPSTTTATVIKTKWRPRCIGGQLVVYESAQGARFSECSELWGKGDEVSVSWTPSGCEGSGYQVGQLIVNQHDVKARRD